MSGRIKPGTVASARVSGQCAVEQTTHLLYGAAAPLAQNEVLTFAEPVGRRSRLWARLRILISSRKQPLIEAACRTAGGEVVALQARVGTLAGLHANEGGQRFVCWTAFSRETVTPSIAAKAQSLS
jgi:hypothetical protein